VGRACLELGAGKARKEDRVDPAAGLAIEASLGRHVGVGDELAIVHARDTAVAESVMERLAAAWRIVPRPIERPPHVIARVDRDRVERFG
jgi:thymidine phosphorylase